MRYRSFGCLIAAARIRGRRAEQSDETVLVWTTDFGEVLRVRHVGQHRLEAAKGLSDEGVGTVLSV